MTSRGLQPSTLYYFGVGGTDAAKNYAFFVDRSDTPSDRRYPELYHHPVKWSSRAKVCLLNTALKREGFRLSRFAV